MIRTAHPTGPFLTSLFGGVLILANGIVLWFIGAIAFATQYASFGNPAEAVGVMEGFLGILIILIATGLFLDPRQPFGFGVTIIALALVSVLGGGGFLVGAALAVLGGMWALWVEPVGLAGPAASLVTPSIDQLCPRCGRRYSGSARACPFCGATSELVRGEAA